MSFAVDLWNGFGKIKEQLNSAYFKIQYLYNILSSYLIYEKEFTTNIENLYKDNKDKIKDEFYLEKSLIQFIDSFKRQSDYHKKHIDFVSKYIMESLKEIMDKEKQKNVMSLFSENAKNYENYIKMKTNLITRQEKYHTSCKEMSMYLSSNSSNNISFISIDNNTKNANLLENISKTFLNKRKKILNKVDEAKNDYILFLCDSNVLLEQYNYETQNILEELESQYESLINVMQWSLINFANNNFALHEKINDLTKDNLEKYYNNVDFKQESKNFIIKYATKEFPFSKFEFIPFKLNLINTSLFKENELKNNSDVCNKKIDLIKKYFQEKNLTNETLFNAGNESDIVFNMSLKKIISLEQQNSLKNSSSIINKNIRRSAGLSERSNGIILEFKDKNNQKNQKEKLLKENLYYIEFFVDKLMLKKNETRKNEIEKMKSVYNIDNASEISLYIEAFINVLNVYRAKGNFLICQNTYDILVDVFIYLLDNFQRHDFLLKNIMILSQTFYAISKTLSNKKIFLQNGIKNHPTFNIHETWHRVINYTLNICTKNKDLTVKTNLEEQKKKLNIMALNTLIAYLCDMKCFTDDNDVYNNVKQYYMSIYELNDKSKDIDEQVNFSIKEMEKNQYIKKK